MDPRTGALPARDVSRLGHKPRNTGERPSGRGRSSPFAMADYQAHRGHAPTAGCPVWVWPNLKHDSCVTPKCPGATWREWGPAEWSHSGSSPVSVAPPDARRNATCEAVAWRLRRTNKASADAAKAKTPPASATLCSRRAPVAPAGAAAGSSNFFARRLRNLFAKTGMGSASAPSSDLAGSACPATGCFFAFSSVSPSCASFGVSSAFAAESAAGLSSTCTSGLSSGFAFGSSCVVAPCSCVLSSASWSATGSTLPVPSFSSSSSCSSAASPSPTSAFFLHVVATNGQSSHTSHCF
mmetsp:Transcript_11485/g.23221  ORF Transcript_11485/g.23221 Transcript_11485/m.23221 type:complete len:296 (-) Transcript_11485:1-888(-)